MYVRTNGLSDFVHLELSIAAKKLYVTTFYISVYTQCEQLISPKLLVRV